MNNNIGKVCRVCKVFTENDGLKKNSSHAGGFESLCKECNSKRMSDLRDRYRVQGVTVSEKKCSYCDVVKPSEDFYVDVTTRDGLKRDCKSCMKERSSVYVNATDGTRLHKVTALVDAYGAQCAYCAENFENRDLEVDHVIPMSKRGAHVFENLVLACKDCNRMKRNYNLGKFALIMGEFFTPIAYIDFIMDMEEEELILRGLKRPLPTDDSVENFRLMVEACASDDGEDENLFDLMMNDVNDDTADCGA